MPYTAPKTVRRRRTAYIASAVMLLLSGTLLLLSRQSAGFAEWYAVRIHPLLLGTVGRLFSLFPFSVFELLVYALVLLAAGVLIRFFILLLSAPRGLGAWAERLLRRAVCLLSALLLLFTLGAGVNYSRASFASLSGLDVEPSSTEELLQLCLLLARDAAAEAENVPSENGVLTLNGFPVRAATQAAVETLGDSYPFLAGWSPQAKPVLASVGLSYLGITGICSPFTLEANYNADVPDYMIPFTICPELTHLKGFMREEEANFIAYLACRSSDEAALRYSGAAMALNYALNALAESADSETYAAAWAALPQALKDDYAAAGLYWEQFNGTISETSERMNDTYLKANAQSDGVASYGRMVDLLLAEYRGRLS